MCISCPLSAFTSLLLKKHLHLQSLHILIFWHLLACLCQAADEYKVALWFLGSPEGLTAYPPPWLLTALVMAVTSLPGEAS